MQRSINFWRVPNPTAGPSPRSTATGMCLSLCGGNRHISHMANMPACLHPEKCAATEMFATLMIADACMHGCDKCSSTDPNTSQARVHVSQWMMRDDQNIRVPSLMASGIKIHHDVSHTPHFRCNPQPRPVYSRDLQAGDRRICVAMAQADAQAIIHSMILVDKNHG